MNTKRKYIFITLFIILLLALPSVFSASYGGCRYGLGSYGQGEDECSDGGGSGGGGGGGGGGGADEEAEEVSALETPTEEAEVAIEPTVSAPEEGAEEVTEGAEEVSAVTEAVGAKKTSLLYILLAVVVVLVIGYLIFKRKRKNY